MPTNPVWSSLFPEDLPAVGVLFRTPKSRRLYFWQPCICCGRPTVFRATNRRLDAVLTFFARDINQGPHLDLLANSINKSFMEGRIDVDTLVDIAELLAEIEMSPPSEPSPTLFRWYPWPKSKRHYRH